MCFKRSSGIGSKNNKNGGRNKKMEKTYRNYREQKSSGLEDTLAGKAKVAEEDDTQKIGLNY